MELAVSQSPDDSNFVANEPLDLTLSVKPTTFVRIDRTPLDRMVFGSVRLGGAQIVPVGGGADWDGYMMKITYDFEPGAGGPTTAWFEFGLAWSDNGDSGGVIVADAVPRLVHEPQSSRSFTLNDNLEFVPGDRVHLPEILPQIDVFGIGGSGIRWVHQAVDRKVGVRPGSRVAWLALVIPAGRTEVSVAVSVRFDLSGDDAGDYEPIYEPARITLRMPPPAAGRAPDVVSREASRSLTPDRPVLVSRRPPQVFICYAHDNEEHRREVLGLAKFLHAVCGIYVSIDRWNCDHRGDWSTWAEHQIKSADFVLIVASPRCKLVGDGYASPVENRSLQAEMAVIRNALYADRPAWTLRLLPVVLPGRSIEEIPDFLQPRSTHYYLVDDYTKQGTEDLLRVITAQPKIIPPRLGDTVIDLPPDPDDD